MWIFGGMRVGKANCRKLMEAEEELSLFLRCCRSRGCSWAQHNTAKPLWIKKNPHFSTSRSKHCGIAPLGKCLPKKEVF